MTEKTETPEGNQAETAPLRVPIFTRADETGAAAVIAFFKGLTQDHVAVARQESERIAPYLQELREQTIHDMEESPGFMTGRLRRTLEDDEGLTKLFNTVSARTRNTILSEIALAPIGLMQQQAVKDSIYRYGGTSHYNDTPFIFGFLQSINPATHGSVSVPLFAFDDAMMAAVQSHGADDLYRSFQAVMTAGNHDMVHHYSNILLNQRIARTGPAPGERLKQWRDKYFSQTDPTKRDSDIRGWESWLVLNHARLRHDMEDGPEGAALKASCSRFFDELERIGKAIDAEGDHEKAHQVVDYFSSTLGFALMRFVPMDHPLMQEAIRRMEQADPDPGSIINRAFSFRNAAQDGTSFLSQATQNYAAKGTDFMKDTDYASLKALEIMNISPTIAHLMSPGQPNTTLAAMQHRVETVNRDMFKAAVHDMKDGWFHRKIHTP